MPARWSYPKENPTCHLDVMTNSTLQDHIKENKHILRQIVHAIIYLGKQGLPFRGDTVTQIGEQLPWLTIL